MHIAMFIGTWLVSTEEYWKKNNDLDEHELKLYWFFYVMRWFHLVTAVLQLLQTHLKTKGYDRISALFNMLIPYFYLFPILYIQYVTGYIHKQDKKNSDVQVWFILETFVFVSQVFGGIVFMFCG